MVLVGGRPALSSLESLESLGTAVATTTVSHAWGAGAHASPGYARIVIPGDAQWRPCRLEPRPLKGAADWLEHYRVFWEQSLDRLEGYLTELQGKEKPRGRKQG